MSYVNYYPSSRMLHASIPLLMGTRLDALLFGDDRARLEEVWYTAVTEMRRLEKMLNRFDATSEVAAINREAQTTTVRLSDDMWQILLDCRRYYELTEGCFDITLSDFRKIRTADAEHSIRFEQEGMMLDFGGYAKGYALRKVHRQLKDARIERALLNLGNSSIMALNSHPLGDTWPIDVEDPYTHRPLATLHLCDSAMSVSGSSPANPQHIVNPAKATLVEGRTIVAIEAEDPLDAETLTTAWIASGEEAEPLWLKNFNLKQTYRLR